MILTIITFILVLSVLVFVHEFGHFWTARKFGVKAEEFGFGFPPRVWGMYKAKDGTWKKVRGNKEVTDAADTIYSINALPIGGFVKIKGEDGENLDPDSFSAQKIWKRIVIVSAGVTMNILLAIVLFSVGFMFGLPMPIPDDLGPDVKVLDRKIQVSHVTADSPAEKAGLKREDTILDINNQTFKSYKEIQEYTDLRTGRDLTYHIDRDGQRLTFIIRPETLKETGKGGIGIGLAETGVLVYPWYQAFWQGIKITFLYTWLILLTVFMLIKQLIVGNTDMAQDVGGPIYIAMETGRAVRRGFSYLVNLTSLLSINLAIINILPFPALDGSRILFLIMEKIRRKPMKKEIEGLIYQIGFYFLIALMLLVVYKDIRKL